MRLFISADIEGVTGVVSFSQCGRGDADHPDFPSARRAFVSDMNAVVEGARLAGMTEITVKDGHGTCKNLLPNGFVDGVSLISGRGGERDGMMDGIDASFGAAMLVGYHAMAGAERAFLEHALVGGLRRFWLNGIPAGEIAVNAAVAGAYGVPVVLVTGDRATCEEARATLPGVRVYETKSAFGKAMGAVLHPSRTWPDLREIAGRAVAERERVAPYRIEGPVVMRAEFRTMEEAELPADVPGVVRIDGKTLEFGGPDLLSAHRLMQDVFRLSMRGRRASE